LACGDCFCEGEEIGGLFRKQAAAFLLVEEEDGARGKAFALRGGDRTRGICPAERIGLASRRPFQRTTKPKPAAAS
jgi:hypothetical protein